MPEGMPRLLPPAKCPNPHQDPGRVEALNIIRQILRDASKGVPKPSFILVLLENRDNFIYPGIKVILPSVTFFFSGKFWSSPVAHRWRGIRSQHHSYATGKGIGWCQEARPILFECCFESQYKTGGDESFGTAFLGIFLSSLWFDHEFPLAGWKCYAVADQEEDDDGRNRRYPSWSRK